MAFWPFSKVFGAGLVSGDVPTHSNLNKLDEQQAQAADGSIWTDIPGSANMAYSTITSALDNMLSASWCELAGAWFVAGLDGSSNATAYMAWPPYIWGESFEPAIVVPAGNAFQYPLVTVCNPAGTLLIGGTPGSGTTAKLRRAAGGSLGGGMTIQDTPTALGIKSLGWFPAAGKFLAGYGSGTAVDTSPDGITWTTRTSPNSHARGAMAASPTRLVWAPSPAVGRSTVITTDDAVTFTERTIGVSYQWAGVTYSAALQTWFLMSVSGAVRASVDGITWTTVGSGPGLTSVIAMCSYGRILFAVGLGAVTNSQEIWCSTDGAVTWRKLAMWSWVDSMSAASIGPGGQLCVISGGGSLSARARFGWRLGG